MWTTYQLIEYVPDVQFVLRRSDNTYSVQYILRPLDEGVTELEYIEWVGQGEIETPFTADVLRKLKTVLEAEQG